MKYIAKSIIIALAILPTAFAGSAQEAKKEKYSLKATAEKSLGNALNIEYAVDGMGSSSSAWNYGVDFGFKIWEKNQHSVEANIGLGYGTYTIKTTLGAMDYHYDAPAEADMDNEPYVRYYKIDGLNQEMRIGRIALPIYANYRYTFNKVISIHALLGFRFGYNISSKMLSSDANVFSYGVYPQYDDLMIDATYMNEFGSARVESASSDTPINKLTSAFMVGVGAEFRIYGPISLDVSLRYEGAMSDMIKPANVNIIDFEAFNSPVTYTVAEGQKAISLPSYFSESKISNFSVALSLLYRF